MTTSRSIGAALAICAAFASASAAAAASPITSSDVIGNWTLSITPAERRGMSVSVEEADGGEPDLPLTVTARTGGGLRCVLRGDPADCRLKEGELIIVMPTQSGGARMTFTISDRTRDGFAGSARFRVRFPPIGGQVGAVTMTPR